MSLKLAWRERLALLTVRQCLARAEASSQARRGCSESHRYLSLSADSRDVVLPGLRESRVSMTSAPTDWAFNNPEFSDVVVLLTNETLADCERRLSGGSPSASDTDDASCHPHTESVYCHKVILSSHSPFFRALFLRWELSSAQLSSPSPNLPASPTDARKYAILPELHPDSFPYIRAMLGYMYTAQIPEDFDRIDLVHLALQANQYMVSPLLHAIARQLALCPWHNWSPDEQSALESLFPIIESAAGADPTAPGTDPHLTDACTVLTNLILSSYLDLEAAWQLPARRAALCRHPQPIIERLLDHEGLQVASENTVLVVLLSWLLHHPTAHWQPLIRRLRLLDLSPLFISLLFRIHPTPASPPETAISALPPADLGWLIQFLAATPVGRDILRPHAPAHAPHWHNPRLRTPATTVTFTKTLTLEEVAALITEASSSRSTMGTIFESDAVHLNGFRNTAGVYARFIEDHATAGGEAVLLCAGTSVAIGVDVPEGGAGLKWVAGVDAPMVMPIDCTVSAMGVDHAPMRTCKELPDDVVVSSKVRKGKVLLTVPRGADMHALLANRMPAGVLELTFTYNANSTC